MLSNELIAKLNDFCLENNIVSPSKWEVTNNIIRYKTTGSSDSGAYLLYENDNNFYLQIMDWAKGDEKFMNVTIKKGDLSVYKNTSNTSKNPKDFNNDEFYKKLHEDTAKRCINKYLTLRDATAENPYCKSKGITPAIGWKEDDCGALYIPFINGAGSLDFDVNLITTLQIIWIDADGKCQKRWSKGGNKKGSYFPIKGDITNQVFLAEGSATAQSIAEATNCSSIMAGDCNNLKHVAKFFPKGVVVADNDKNDAGENAAKDTGLPYKLIPVKGMDANDYAVAYGVSRLKSFLLPYPDGCNELLNWLKHKPNRSWLIENVFPECVDVDQEHGPSQGGKTLVKISQQIALATGTDWMGRKTKQCNVLSLIGESENSEKERICANIQARPEISADILNEHLFICTDVFNLNEKAGEEKLCNILDFYALHGMKIDVMFVDNLRLYYSGSEIDNDEVSMFVKTLKKIAKKYEMYVIYYCHDRKADKDGKIGDQARGGQSLYDLSDSVHWIHNENGVIFYENQKNKISCLDETVCMDIVSCPLEGETDNFGNPVVGAYLKKHSGSITINSFTDYKVQKNAAEKAIEEYFAKYGCDYVEIATLLNLYEGEYKKKYPLGKSFKGDIIGESIKHYNKRIKDAIKSYGKKLKIVASDPSGKYEIKDNTIFLKGMCPQKSFVFEEESQADDEEKNEVFTYKTTDYVSWDVVAEGEGDYFSDDKHDTPFSF